MNPIIILAALVIGLIAVGRFYIKVVKEKFKEARKELREKFEKAIEEGKINTTDDKGYTYLMLSLMGKFDDYSHRMIKAVDDIDFKGPTGETALHYAAHFSDAQTVDLLLENGADPTMADQNGCTPLWFAAQNNKPEIAKRLLKSKADMNRTDQKYGFSPLMIAAQNGNYAVVDVLIDAGADRSIQSNEGETAHAIAEARLTDNIKRLEGDKRDELNRMIEKLKMD